MLTQIWKVGDYSLGAHSFGELKIWIVAASGLSRDALHIYIGLVIYLTVRTLLRRHVAARWAALAVVGVAALGGEALDHWHELSKAMGCNSKEHFHDLWNTALAPTLLVLSEPLWAGWASRTRTEEDVS